MASWREFETEAPELAALVRARFERTKHHVLATLRRDGSPRVSGTEVVFWRDDLFLGSMWHAMKALDLERDGRFAIHSNPGSPEMVGGDSKLVGVATEVEGADHEAFQAELDPPTPFQLFRLSLSEVVHTSLNQAEDGLQVQFWRPGSPVSVVERR
ncbi:MAG TPA: hypothetical protein VL068_01065 [Microthrixaceae bacterium]|nr:hypothetical protein [Microthrixaceae bacterium]